jgi:hypothetical protein
MPPSTVRTWPVMYFASGAARKANRGGDVFAFAEFA